jgi:toxin ParE1/3/4
LGCIDGLEQAYVHISEYPATGLPRYAHELNLPGLQFWPITKYQHLVFYVEQSQHITVWRVFHGERDIRVLMQEHIDQPNELKKYHQPSMRRPPTGSLTDLGNR